MTLILTVESRLVHLESMTFLGATADGHSLAGHLYSFSPGRSEAEVQAEALQQRIMGCCLRRHRGEVIWRFLAPGPRSAHADPRPPSSALLQLLLYSTISSTLQPISAHFRRSLNRAIPYRQAKQQTHSQQHSKYSALGNNKANKKSGIAVKYCHYNVEESLLYVPTMPTLIG